MASKLVLSDRLLKISRQVSIKTIYDALVELLTNSDDAYNNVNVKEKNFIIKIIRDNKEEVRLPSSIIVIDQALGMSLEQMKTNLLTVGYYTASSSSRGMMGRGAKDCSVLGDITFTCIKDNKLSQIIIYQNMDTKILLEDIDITDDLREQYNVIIDGTHVELKTDASLIPDIEIVRVNLQNNIYLRNLFQDFQSTVLLVEEEVKYNERMVYNPPKRTLVISCDYDIPDYNTTAHLEIYTSDNKLPIPQSDDQREYGILVSSKSSIYECSALYYSDPIVQNLIWNSNIQLITGSLSCKLINQLARDATNGVLSSENPFLLIDPNRRNGLDPTHPFTKALYTSGYNMLNVVLGRIQDNADDKLFDFGDIKDVFNGFNEVLSEALPSDNLIYSWRSREDTEKLLKLSKVVRNVKMDDVFMGINFDDVKSMHEKKYLIAQTKETQKSSIRISFSDDKNMKTAYEVLYMVGYTNIRINVNDISIKKYLSIKNNVLVIENNASALMGIGNIINDAVNYLILRNKILTGQTKDLTINSLNEYVFHSNESKQKMSPLVYNFMLGNIDMLSKKS